MNVLISILIAFGIPISLTLYYSIWKWVDLLLRVSLAEVNRAANQRRLTKRTQVREKSHDIVDTIISIVGYREDARIYERALTSMGNAGGATVIVGIDGNDAEDMPMVQVCRKVFEKNLVELHLPVSIGRQYYREIRPHADNALEEGAAFEEACVFLASELEKVGITKGNISTLPKAICFTQPHGDLKEIRLTSWTLAVVLGKYFDLKYLWSTDSDTIVPQETVGTMASVLAATPKAGGASAYVRLHNEADTTISRMTGVLFGLDMYLNRSSTGGINQSEYLHGPASMFRLSALQQVIVPWCRWHYFFSDRSRNTVINEDIQYSMLLSQRGWQRLYVDNASILTGGPDNLRSFLGQRLRWSRGIMVHRILDAGYIIKEGPLTMWYMLRTAFYDSIIFVLVLYYALYGKMLLPITKWDILAMEVLPPLYNYFRAPTPMPDLLSASGLYMLYRFLCPSFRMYTFLTPFNTTWALPSEGDSAGFKLMSFIKEEHEGLFFTLWTGIASAAITRVTLSYVPVHGVSWIIIMSLSVLIASSIAGRLMFSTKFIRPRASTV